MLLGELDYIEVFLQPILKGETLPPFSGLAFLVLVIFAIVIPIAAMNLMVNGL